MLWCGFPVFILFQFLGSLNFSFLFKVENKFFYYFFRLPWWLRWQGILLQCGRPGLVPGLGRSPAGGHDNPLQYSYLENPVDGRGRLATVRGVTESRSWLKQLQLSIAHYFFMVLFGKLSICQCTLGLQLHHIWQPRIYPQVLSFIHSGLSFFSLFLKIAYSCFVFMFTDPLFSAVLCFKFIPWVFLKKSYIVFSVLETKSANFHRFSPSSETSLLMFPIILKYIYNCLKSLLCTSRFSVISNLVSMTAFYPRLHTSLLV